MAKKLSPADAFFMQVEKPETPMHIGGLNRFTLPKGAGKRWIYEQFEAMRSYPVQRSPFNLRLAGGQKKGLMPELEVDQDIDIDYHLRHSALPQPGGERELGILVSRLHSTPLDRARPLWEFHLIEGLKNRQFAIYSKMHHSLIDGMAAARLTRRFLSDDPEARDLPPIWALPEVKRQPRSTTSAGVNPLVLALNQVGEQIKTVPAVTRSLGNLIRGPRNRDLPNLVAPYTAPECLLNQPISPQRRFATQSLAQSRFEKIAKATGGTMNDVVLAICGGALRRYLQELNDLPDRPLIASIPVSVRPKDDTGEGNAISMVLTDLATNEPDVRKRYERIRASMSDSKKLLRSMNQQEITNYSALMMAPFLIGQVSGLGARRKRPMYNVVISNVPGPADPMYYNGAKMLSSHPVSLIFNGQAVNITIFSYDGNFNIGFTACRTVLPHVQHLAVYTGEALEELEKKLL